MTTPVESGVLLEVTDLVRHYTLPRERLFAPPPMVKALNGVSFSIPSGRSLGIVGESGSNWQVDHRAAGHGAGSPKLGNGQAARP